MMPPNKSLHWSPDGSCHTFGTAMMLAPHEVHQLLGIIELNHKPQQMNHRIPAFAVNHCRSLRRLYSP
jgi:hypothetical protein